MKIMLEPGLYVLAVSGGVDSIALLHLVKDTPDVKFVIAHFDHGIRDDSAEDRRLVESLAKRYEMPFVYGEGRLGKKASEAVARQARYKFLDKVRQSTNAKAVITAHHQDDMIETAIINIIRGTNRKGLSSISNQGSILRPMLHLTKKELINYAKENSLEWREDVTNNDQKYLRNYVRHSIVPKLTPEQRLQLVNLIWKQERLNNQIDELLINVLHSQSANCQLDRLWFQRLSHVESREVMASWLRANNLQTFDRMTIERLTVTAKVAKPVKRVDVLNGTQMEIRKLTLALMPIER
jgi:tRNA(Ile)-lysidine synthetase-like protein